jgi:hypothetical protein
MRRRVVPVFAASIVVLLVALAGPAQAAFVVKQVIGRRLVSYSVGSASWQASAQIQHGDTNGNGLIDSADGRCAVKETAGLSRVRITACAYQEKIDTNGNSVPDTWVNRLVNQTDVAAASFAVSLTPSQRLCFANPNLRRPHRVRNFHVVRRSSDSALFYRTTNSFEVLTRALADDIGCKSSADLAVSKTFVDIQDPEGGDVVGPIAAVDDTFQYRITVTNPTGGATATFVTVADDYPADLDDPVPGPGCTIDINAGGEPNVVCEKQWLEPGDSVTFTITARTNGSTGAAVEANIASLIAAQQPDPNLANNSDGVVVTTG